MNLPDRTFVNAGRSFTAARILGALGAAALVSGCMGNPFQDAQVDPRSPVAAEVAKAARANADYPSFAEIPAVPTDVRPLAMWGRDARAAQQARAELERATAPETWSLSNTEGFAATARRQAGPEIQPASPANTDAYANELRRRATPPPPPKR